jgi:ABC-type microcin C transport system duplicated ATPase subunit YejF
MNRSQARERAAQLLELVDISPERLRSYPHQCSGGMRQRIVIAICLALNPKLLIMDEPTTALDVVVQREILQRIDKLRVEFGFSVLFITHDLGLMVQVCDRIGGDARRQAGRGQYGARYLYRAPARLYPQALGLDAAAAWRTDQAGCPMTDQTPILALDNVSKVFGPGRWRSLRCPLGVLCPQSWPHPGACGRVGQRQDHLRAADHARISA